jgi:hypothetical protein
LLFAIDIAFIRHFHFQADFAAVSLSRIFATLPPAPSPPHFFRQRQLLPAAFAAATPLSMKADIAIITPLLIFAIYFRSRFHCRRHFRCATDTMPLALAG